MRGRALALALPLLAACACAPRVATTATNTTPGNPDALAARVTAIADAYVRAYDERNPASSLFDGRPDVHPARLPDNSPAARRAWEAREDAWAAELARIDDRALDGRPERVTLGYLREAVLPQRALRACRGHLWPVNQMGGWHVTFSRLAEMVPVGTARQREDALARFGAVPRYVDTEIANLREGARTGWTAPRQTVTLVVAQLDAMLADSVTASPWFSPAARDSSGELRARWTVVVRDAVMPALRRYRDFLRDEYAATARTDAGAWALPEGEACYRASLRAWTTVDRSPDSVFAMAEREVARREAILMQLGDSLYGVKTAGDFYRRLTEDPRNRVASREELMRVVNEAIARAESRLPRWFNILPQARLVVEPFPAAREGTGSSGQYEPASADGSRPGTFLINLSRPEQQRKGAIEPLVFHEALPGHHLQLSIARGRPALHPIAGVVFNGGFTEGWGKYAETLADEMGLYSGEIDRLGYLASIPTIMVVDVGLHARRWSREQAIDYLMARHPTAPRTFMASWVDRVALWPGQAVTYHLGALEFLALREQARQSLGTRFDVRAFHDRVLEDGTITLPMLREKIERWLQTSR